MILQENSAARNRGITLASIKGIIGNVVLVIFKMIVGLASNSIAIILDAVNNLTDVLSSVLTIVGTKLAAKGADKEHPFGHGRSEYMTTMASDREGDESIFGGWACAGGGYSGTWQDDHGDCFHHPWCRYWIP